MKTQDLLCNPESFLVIPFSPGIFRYCAHHPGETLGSLHSRWAGGKEQRMSSPNKICK